MFGDTRILKTDPLNNCRLFTTGKKKKTRHTRYSTKLKEKSLIAPIHNKPGGHERKGRRMNRNPPALPPPLPAYPPARPRSISFTGDTASLPQHFIASPPSFLQLSCYRGYVPLNSAISNCFTVLTWQTAWHYDLRSLFTSRISRLTQMLVTHLITRIGDQGKDSQEVCV